MTTPAPAHDQETFRDLLESAPDAMIIVGTDGRIVQVNTQAELLFGYARDELVGRSVDRLVPMRSREGHEANRTSYLAHPHHRPMSDKMEQIGLRKDGTERPIEISLSPLHTADGMLVCCAIRDITERKRVEEELRRSRASLAEAQQLAGIGSWDFDFIANALDWSDEALAIFEFPRPQKPTFDAFLERVHPADRDRVEGAYAQSMNARQGCDIEYRLQMDDGRIKHVHERGRTDYDASGTPMRSVGTVQDITWRMTAEAQRHLLEAELRQAQKMDALGTLAGGIAHDFNNILSAIFGNLELAAEEIAPDAPAQVSLRAARTASERARDLVGQILTFSRQQPPERVVLDLRTVVQESLGILRTAIPPGVELVTSFASELPSVLADCTQINQILINLCTNAWQAMEGRSGRIDIRLAAAVLDDMASTVAPELLPGQFVKLSVTDTGKGIDAATASRIFDPFFTTKAAGEGTGLGLAVVHGIVRAHGGAVTLGLEEQGSTTFNLYFPAHDELAEEVTTRRQDVTPGHGESVLYLDDERQVTHVVCRMLERLGYQPCGFSRAADAIEAVRRQPELFALAILDFNMPDASGLQVAEEMLQLRPDLPIALSSGFVTDGLRENARTLGLRDILHKPYSVRELGAMIHRVLSPALSS